MAIDQASALAPPRAKPGIEGCADCARDCLEACFNEAIAALPLGGVELDSMRCAGCGACIPACDRDRIRLAHGVASFVWD
jgi:Fe-S-cluster-containing hydrogenase component 2